MSRFFPHPSYAEDQPYAKTILTTHVLTRGLTTGAVIGGVLFGGRAFVTRLSSSSSSSSTSGTSIKTSASNSNNINSQTSPLARRLIRGVGVSTLWTMGLVGLGMVARMWGREGIEWKDRSWRLLENKGQLECDDWTYAGMAVGVIAASVVMIRSRGRAMVPPVALAGGGGPVGKGGKAIEILGMASLGSFAGMLGYMTWRNGVHGGKFPSD